MDLNRSLQKWTVISNFSLLCVSFIVFVMCVLLLREIYYTEALFFNWVHVLNVMAFFSLIECVHAMFFIKHLSLLAFFFFFLHVNSSVRLSLINNVIRFSNEGKHWDDLFVISQKQVFGANASVLFNVSSSWVFIKK